MSLARFVVVDTFVETKQSHVVEMCIVKRTTFSSVDTFVETNDVTWWTSIYICKTTFTAVSRHFC